MRGFRITCSKEYEEVMSSKRIVPTKCGLHAYENNSFGSHCGRAFWFYTTLEDALCHFYAVGHEGDYICEYDIPDEIVTNGHGYYWHCPVDEFITREIRSQWLIAANTPHIDHYEECEDMWGLRSFPIYAI